MKIIVYNKIHPVWTQGKLDNILPRKGNFDMAVNTILFKQAGIIGFEMKIRLGFFNDAKTAATHGESFYTYQFPDLVDYPNLESEDMIEYITTLFTNQINEMISLYNTSEYKHPVYDQMLFSEEKSRSFVKEALRGTTLN